MTFIPQNNPLTGKPYGFSLEDNERIIPKTDSIVDSIIDRFVERAQVGMKKYGTNLDRTDLSLEQWLEHSIEEQLDNILYMQRALKELREAKTL
jgi:hypothetical protein